mmetsp:Transcript_6782/g.18358  ORF Transcript_6782/g.18358 Transcript_6782/m.18358 type:complete len:88 (+) Transcript_6782:128-391(+)
MVTENWAAMKARNSDTATKVVDAACEGALSHPLAHTQHESRTESASPPRPPAPPTSPRRQTRGNGNDSNDSGDDRGDCAVTTTKVSL